METTMKKNRTWMQWVAGAVTTLALAGAACAGGTVGTTLPADFPVIADASLGTPVIGFGAAGPVARTPVVFLHGNNDAPFPTFTPAGVPCVVYGRVHAFAQYLADRGYAPSELWGLGYQGDQCDLKVDNTRRSGVAHTVTANVDDLRRFVEAVLAYTGAKEVDIVGHSLGVTLAREWMRQDHSERKVRRLVAIDGPNHGIVNCSPNPANYYQLAAFGGFTPHSAVCQELGSPNTAFLQRLNHGIETRGATRTLVIRNADTSFVYFARQDGFFTPVPAEDVFGQPVDFSQSAALEGADHRLDLVGQGAFDPFAATAHLGILNSPQTWAATFDFLSDPSPRR
jgi:pimeloyl-ACP methyl ester carboxylesterase